MKSSNKYKLTMRDTIMVKWRNNKNDIYHTIFYTANAYAEE